MRTKLDNLEKGSMSLVEAEVTVPERLWSVCLDIDTSQFVSEALESM